MGTLEELEDRIAAARERAHTASMNQVGEDHRGRRSLLTHSMAWANASREYAELLRRARITALEEEGKS